jgi:putative alpha-1,2-mannosidase
VDRAVINVEGGRTFTIRAVNNSAENRYIQSVTLNGVPYTKPYIAHADITAGGELIFTMSPYAPARK